MQFVVIRDLGGTDQYLGPFSTKAAANDWGIAHSANGFFVVPLGSVSEPEPLDPELLALTKSVASAIRDLVSAVIDFESESEGRWYKGVDDGIESISTFLAKAIQHKMGVKSC